MKAAPVQALSAAVAVGLVFPFQCRAALRTDWKSSKTVFCAVNADLLDRHRHTEMLFWLVCGTYEQIVWRPVQIFSSVTMAGAVRHRIMEPKYLALKLHRSAARS